MSKIIKPVLAVALIFVAVFFLYKIVCIRTVNYEIAGLSVPSHYNILTGKVTPIIDYNGKKDLPALSPSETGNIGLSEEQVAAARIRWALFEQWTKARGQYKGWESDPEIFRRANEGFKKEYETNGPKIKVLE